MSGSAARDGFRACLEARRDERPGLAARRAAAWASFEEQGIPTTRHEDWRFTNLAPFREIAWTLAPPGAAPEVSLPSPSGYRIAFVNGVFSPAHSSPGGPPAGVRMERLSDALEERPEAVEDRIGALADDKQRAFTALNTALFEDGALVEVEAGVSLEQPLELLRIQTGPAADCASHPRNLVSIGAGSRAVIVERSLGAGAQVSLSNSVTEVFVGRDAHLEHVALQEEGPEAYHLAALAVRQEPGSHFVSHSIALGARLARIEIAVTLAGEGAHCRLNGLYLGRELQTLDHHTTIDHATAHTTSDELYKGVLADRAHGIFHGRIHVRPHAQKISAMQTNRNLLLSDRATVNTKPQLEIFANDVRCSHGATIGQLDQDQLFYLRSRGIEAEAARALLTYGFVSEMILALPLPELRSRLEGLVLGWPPRGEKR